MTQHRFMQICPGGTMAAMGSAEEAVKAAGNGCYAWLDYRDPRPEDLEPLKGLLGIHPLSIADCLDDLQVPKINNFENSTFLLVNPYAYNNGALETREIDFIIGEGFLVTVAGRAANWDKEEIDAFLQLEPQNLGQGPDFLLHALLNFAVDAKHHAIDEIESKVDEAEASIIRDLSGFDMSRLVALRRDILNMRKSLFYEREVFIKLCRRDSPFITEKSLYHFRDVYDHLTKYYEETEIYREVILSLTEMYLSMVNNRMSLIANRTNTTVRRLTYITTIFMPLTLVAGIFGMSEWSMITGPDNWKISYPAFGLAMAVLGALTYIALRKLEARLAKKEE